MFSSKIRFAGFLCANEKNIVSFNLCAYCENDPVNGIDPSGYSKSKKATSLYTSDLNMGHVTLKEETTDKVYIYRIPKMDIDCDYHEPQRAVTFVSE